jgi:hypothetical protein
MLVRWSLRVGGGGRLGLLGSDGICGEGERLLSWHRRDIGLGVMTATQILKRSTRHILVAERSLQVVSHNWKSIEPSVRGVMSRRSGCWVGPCRLAT